jgi:hypothetical protein
VRFSLRCVLSLACEGSVESLYENTRCICSILRSLLVASDRLYPMNTLLSEVSMEEAIHH